MSELGDQIRATIDSSVPDTLWLDLEAELQPTLLTPLKEASNPVRQALGAGIVLVVGGLAVGFQGVRSDLTLEQWLLFAVLGGLLAVAGMLAVREQQRPLWQPPVRLALPLLAVALLLAGVAPWPGVRNIPPSMHTVCLFATTCTVLVMTLGLAVLERARKPVASRVFLGALGAGCAGFVSQSVFCPGVDLAHLVLGHSGAGFLVGGLSAGAVVLWQILTDVDGEVPDRA